MSIPAGEQVVVSVDPDVEARRAQQRASTAELQASFRHELNVAFGDHPRQVLDLYYPHTATPVAAPVLVFLHGGGFRNGAPGLHGFQGRTYLERGCVFVSMGYRLMPDIYFPDTQEDVELGLQWLHDHIAERGGDNARIYLSGHSAGAMLAAVAGLRNWPAYCKLPPDFIKGLVLISGMYDHAQPSANINPSSPRFVPRLAEAIQRLPEHTILVSGDDDLPAVLPDARSLLAAIRGKGGSAELFVEANADHFQANRGFVAPDGQVAQAVMRMMRLG
jgi:acetyl esterase/lipase